MKAMMITDKNAMTQRELNKYVTDAVADLIGELLEYDGSYEGRFDGEFEVDENITVNLKGWYRQEGYVEDDYYNGTGGWIMTDRQVCIEDWDVITYDEEGEEIENIIKIDALRIEKDFAA